jgi:hypothetical protein
MPRRSSAEDFLEDYRVTKDRVRRLELRPLAPTGGRKFMISHNFIVGGLVDPATYIPPALVYVPNLGEEGIAQRTFLYGVYGSFCKIGSIGISLMHIRGASESLLTDTVQLLSGDAVRAEVVSGSGEDLTVWYVLIHDLS